MLNCRHEVITAPLHWSAHGVVGGASAEAQGGKFGQGFISAAFTKAVSTQGLLPGKQGELSIERLAGHAVVGGTASALSGGKFANGAQTAAYGYLYNEFASMIVEGSYTKGNQHSYRIKGRICNKSTACDKEYATKVRDYVFENDVPFTKDDRMIGDHSLDPSGYGFFSLPINHKEYPDRFFSRNTALRGHIFYPGVVDHRIYFESVNPHLDVLIYEISGSGSGYFARLNNFLGINEFRPSVEDVVRQFKQ